MISCWFFFVCSFVIRTHRNIYNTIDMRIHWVYMLLCCHSRVVCTFRSFLTTNSAFTIHEFTMRCFSGCVRDSIHFTYLFLMFFVCFFFMIDITRTHWICFFFFAFIFLMNFHYFFSYSFPHWMTFELEVILRN